jgi:Protein of unknown function (DUF1559)
VKIEFLSFDMIRRRGLTRLEILAALVVAFFALGVVAMMIARQRERMMRVQCSNNMKMLGEAMHQYHDVSSADKKLKRLPPSRIADGYATWGVLLAPYLTKESSLLAWDEQLSYFDQKDDARQPVLIQFICPARRRDDLLSAAGDFDKAGKHISGAVGDYGAVAGDGSKDHDWTGPNANGALVIADVLQRNGDRIVKWESRTSFESLTRGQSETMLLGEKHVLPDHLGDAEFGDGSLYNGARPANFSRVAGPGFPLAQSMDAPFNNNFGSWHHGICHFLMADGTVRPMAIHVSEFVLGEIARREP